ncbi:hypothetical protein PIB30_041550, partial [Stylosanthes scabra]|nr:hypothetical protein [Stylosanthes scabra]
DGACWEETDQGGAERRRKFQGEPGTAPTEEGLGAFRIRYQARRDTVEVCGISPVTGKKPTELE